MNTSSADIKKSAPKKNILLRTFSQTEAEALKQQQQQEQLNNLLIQQQEQQKQQEQQQQLNNLLIQQQEQQQKQQEQLQLNNLLIQQQEQQQKQDHQQQLNNLLIQQQEQEQLNNLLIQQQQLQRQQSVTQTLMNFLKQTTSVGSISSGYTTNSDGEIVRQPSADFKIESDLLMISGDSKNSPSTDQQQQVAEFWEYSSLFYFSELNFELFLFKKERSNASECKSNK